MVGVLLDTCVISEIDHDRPNPRVVEALGRYSTSDLYISVLSIGELTYVIELLPPSHRRTRYAERRTAILLDFANRILAIDTDTATVWGEILAQGRRAGTPLESPDTFIAATAIRHGLQVMTRNVRHFEPTGVSIVNPWIDE